MKKLVILLLVLVLTVPFSIASETKNVIVGSKVVSSIKDGEVKYYHQDRLGSTRLSSDTNGEVVDEYRSLPFGENIIESESRYEFTGKERDSSGLHYFGARYYDSSIGRFTGVDPVVSNNPYSYVENNPIAYVDPDGRNLVALLWALGAYAISELTIGATPLNEGEEFDLANPNLQRGPAHNTVKDAFNRDLAAMGVEVGVTIGAAYFGPMASKAASGAMRRMFSEAVPEVVEMGLESKPVSRGFQRAMERISRNIKGSGEVLSIHNREITYHNSVFLRDTLYDPGIMKEMRNYLTRKATGSFEIKLVVDDAGKILGIVPSELDDIGTRMFMNEIGDLSSDSGRHVIRSVFDPDKGFTGLVEESTEMLSRDSWGQLRNDLGMDFLPEG